MKGFDVILVATTKWVAESGTAIQWHLVEADYERSDIFDYVWDSQYYIWDVGEKPTLENIRQAPAFFVDQRYWGIGICSLYYYTWHSIRLI